MTPNPNRPTIHRLLPHPRRIEAVEGEFHLGASTRIVVEANGSDRALFAAERLAELIEQEFDVVLEIDRAEGAAFRITLTNSPGTPETPDLLADHDLGTEGYALEVSADAARVQAPTAEGLFWGAMTLRQLVERRGVELVARGARIVDWPHYRWRGFMIDSGRCPNSLEQMKRIVRVCSAFKLNFVVFREGDDELCSVKYETNPLGSKHPLALSMNEIRDFAAYADRYGVTLVPEIESLGHSTAKGIYYPDLVSGGFEHAYEGIGTHTRKSHLTPGDSRSYELLESIYNEWARVIRSPLMHLGLDEVRLSVEEQAAHLEGLLATLDRAAKAHGKEIMPIVWADAPATPDEFVGRVVRCLWDYGDSPSTRDLDNPHLLRQGLEELLREDCPEPVFMAAGSGSGHTPYSKTGYEAAFRNFAEWTILGKDHPNFQGLLCVQWSGNMLDEWLPDFAAGADCGWNPPEAIPEFGPQMETVRWQLARLTDAADPRPEEVDRHAWDAIWLRDGDWDEDIMTGKKKERA